MTDTVPTRLYLSAPRRIEDPAAFAALAASVIEACAPACLRFEADDEDGARAITAALGPVCAARETALLIVDRFDLVRPLGLDGVHLRYGRLTRDARDMLGEDASLGTFCAGSRHAGLTAAEAGADYVSFEPSGEEGGALIDWWQQMIELPCVADAVRDPDEARILAGRADFIVPGSTLWENEDPAALAAAYAEAVSG